MGRYFSPKRKANETYLLDIVFSPNGKNSERLRAADEKAASGGWSAETVLRETLFSFESVTLIYFAAKDFDCVAAMCFDCIILITICI